jgi:hypothetical protein
VTGCAALIANAACDDSSAPNLGYYPKGGAAGAAAGSIVSPDGGSCVGVGQLCSKSYDCCGTYACKTGRCCVPDSSHCASTSECCEPLSTCVGGTCLSNPDGGGGGGAGGAGGGAAGAGGAAGGGVAGTGGVVPEGGTAALGAVCTSSSVCGGLTCLTAANSDLWGGGPANGYCTMDCSGSLVSDSAADPCTPIGGICVVASLTSPPTRAYCVKKCTPGPAMGSGDFGKFDPNKCHGRKDVACTPFQDEQGNPVASGCLPNCTDDSQCAAAGKKCDPSSAVCVTAPHTGLAFGSNCTQWALSDGDAGTGCAGLCLGVIKCPDASASDPNYAAFFCTQSCVLGDFNSCGYQKQPQAGICVWAEASAGNGDMAFCGQMCDTNADCLDQKDKSTCDTSSVSNLGRGLCGPGC